MKPFSPMPMAAAWFAAAMLFFSGCASRPPSFDVLRPPVEDLYRLYLELEENRSALRVAGQVHFFGANDTLARVQTLNLLLGEANLVAYYQWRLLSITEYVKPSHLEDFFTLRRSGLAQAVERSGTILQLMDIYQVGVEDRRVIDIVHEGRKLVAAQVQTYRRLVAEIEPLARPRSVFQSPPPAP